MQHPFHCHHHSKPLCHHKQPGIDRLSSTIHRHNRTAHTARTAHDRTGACCPAFPWMYHSIRIVTPYHTPQHLSPSRLMLQRYLIHTIVHTPHHSAHIVCGGGMRCLHHTVITSPRSPSSTSFLIFLCNRSCRMRVCGHDRPPHTCHMTRLRHAWACGTLKLSSEVPGVPIPTSSSRTRCPAYH